MGWHGAISCAASHYQKYANTHSLAPPALLCVVRRRLEQMGGMKGDWGLSCPNVCQPLCTMLCQCWLIVKVPSVYMSPPQTQPPVHTPAK
jgi:hypothetical protein